MNAIQIWTMAARPKTLAASIGPIITGAVIALSTGYFNGITFLMTLLAGLGIQIGTNFANDYFDFIKGADTDHRKGPKRVTQAGLVSLQAMKNAILVCFLVTALCGCYLIWHGGFPIACLLALSILLGVIYTGGPFPLAYLGLGDLFVFVFFGPVSVGCTYYLQAHHFSWEPVLAGIGPGAIATAILAVNNIRDIEEDKIANKRTLPVRFGRKFGQREYLFLIMAAFAIPFLFVQYHPFCLLASLFIFPALPLIKAVYRDISAQALNQALSKTGQLLLIYSSLFCIGWMIS